MARRRYFGGALAIALIMLPAAPAAADEATPIDPRPVVVVPRADVGDCGRVRSVDPGFIARIEDHPEDRGFVVVAEDRSNDAGFFPVSPCPVGGG